MLKVVLPLASVLMAAGCATDPVREAPPAKPAMVDPAVAQRILLLDPEHVSEGDVRDTLAKGPTPQIVNLHGGIYPVHLAMTDFAEFLIGMGYPAEKVRHPGRGEYSHSPYETSEKLAGLVAWYYERDGVRPMLIGHSQGGMQAVKVLHTLNGAFGAHVAVWNPVADAAEARTTIVDPLTGRERPVVGLSVAYATAVAAGGVAFLLPNQWSMADRLRTIPDTVDEFTGFFIEVDLWAWNSPDSVRTQRYVQNGQAAVRNVSLPAGYNHVFVPVTSHLAKNSRMRSWINAYQPRRIDSLPPLPGGSSDNVLWAADVWHSVKKHWSLEAQRLIRAQQAAHATPGGATPGTATSGPATAPARVQ